MDEIDVKQAIIGNMPKLNYPVTEALNTMCTNLSLAGRSYKKILITSTRPGEGKTFIAFNLMRLLAGLRHNVVLVDADMRRSDLVDSYGVQMEQKAAGLAHYLAEQCEWEKIVRQTNIDGGYLVPNGQNVVSMLPLLSTPRLPRLLSQLERAFDIALVDTLPIGSIIDAAEIARSCDGAVFVVSSNNVKRRKFIDAKEQILRTGCPILGGVLNKVTYDTPSAKKHYYKTYYSHYNSGYYKHETVSEKEKKDLASQ
jgi:capsular exopolysaccharide synthesis family protein